MPPKSPFVFALAILLASPLALADAGAPKSPFEESRAPDGQSIVFDDDEALGKALDPLLDITRGNIRPARVLLMRPRYEFVSEMLKSVEAM